MSRQRFKKDVLLKDYCTYGIGGPAKFFAEVHSREELIESIAEIQRLKLPFVMIGKGSNILFDDRGFEGVVLLNKMTHFSIEGRRVWAESGMSFPLLGSKTASKGLAGLEFASGIPGTVGGAVFMNAGASGLETKDHLVEVEFVDGEGTMMRFTKEEMAFSYRHSSFQDMPGAIVSATFELESDPKAKERLKEIVTYRLATQPYKDKSCGCIFRNPEKVAAGQLIEECGLKGFSIGGASVSTMHANFFVNEGGTAQNILDLITYVKLKVYVRSGITMQEEVRYIPYEGANDALRPTLS